MTCCRTHPAASSARTRTSSATRAAFISSDVEIRRERSADHGEVAALIAAAFAPLANSDHREHELVARLRTAPGFVPGLSLVAVAARQIVGHILFTPVVIGDRAALALAPVSVRPEWQSRGIGGRLIAAGHDAGRRLGYAAAVVLGHPGYYPRFGYVRADLHGVTLPFAAPPEACMVGALAGEIPRGRVEYPPEFAG